MIKESNKRVMVTLPIWLLEKYQQTDYYKVIGNENLSQAFRNHLIEVVTGEYATKLKKEK